MRNSPPERSHPSGPGTPEGSPGSIHVFGLTGGLASGKSTVASQLRARGVPVIDADALAREVVAPGTDGLRDVVRQFGADVLHDGELDRKRLAAIVFARPDQRELLEGITHPRIQALRAQRLRELAERGEPLAAYEVPLLYEKGLERELHPIVVVYVPESVQLARATARDRSTEEQARARLAAQLPLEEKARRADYVIDNTAAPDTTRAAVDDVLRRICMRLGVDPSRYFEPSQRTSGGGGSDRVL